MSTHRAIGPGELARASWHKSSRSGSSANCVEIAELHDGHWAVRDSKQPDGPVLVFTPSEWTAFTRGMRDSDFD